MKLAARKRKFKLNLKKIKLCNNDDLENTADSLSNTSSVKTKSSPEGGKFNQTKLYQIEPNLFMSGYHSASDISILKEFNISHIINLTSQHCANLNTFHVTYSNFKLSDNSNFSLIPYFDTITNLIQEKINEGQKVLIHCKMGVSRAPSLIIAYLIKKKGMKYKEAFEFLYSINPKIAPNLGYLMQLQEL